jgi:soluble lytic murein transglycosylase-like protein
LVILFFFILYLLLYNKTPDIRQFSPEEQSIINTWKWQAKNESEFGEYSDVPYWSIIKKHAKRYGVDPHLVRAVIRVESRFNPRARSRAGALGLMQLMPNYHYCKDYFNPDENIKVGTKLLAGYIKQEGNIRLALRRYNSGHRKLNNGYDKKVLAYL